MKIRVLIVISLIFVLFSANVAAFSFDSIYKSIKEMFKSIMGSEKPTSTTMFCNKPYIQIGGECCLDKSDNGICDEDEVTTTIKQTTTSKPTTTLKVTTTTSTTIIHQSTTSTTSTTTTTKPQIACSDQSDCGETTYKLECHNNDVYNRSTYPLCKNAGTEEAECIWRQSTVMRRNNFITPFIDCGTKNCYQGVCGASKPKTTSTQPSQTTTSFFPTPTTLSSTTITTPKCGDGVFSWHGANPEGTEECENGLIPCPSGLSCVNCKCTGCGNGKLESGEECEPNNRLMRYNSQYLWSSKSTSCSGQYEYCNPNTCECDSSIQCNAPLHNSENCDNSCLPSEICQQYQSTPCYKCEKNCPLDEGGVDYYSTEGCEGNCFSSLCRQVKTHEPQSEYKECYRCYDPVCGNDIIEPGEQCEVDFDCPDYHYCDSPSPGDCQCVTDCDDFCAGATNGGWINTRMGGAPTIGSSNQCSNWASTKLGAINKNCFTSCVSSEYLSGLTEECCCVDWNSLQAKSPCPCQVGVNCPVTMPSQQECLDTLWMGP